MSAFELIELSFDPEEAKPTLEDEFTMTMVAKDLEKLSGQQVENGCLDPTFYRDDLARVGTRIAQVTNLPSSVDDREVVLTACLDDQDAVEFAGEELRNDKDFLLE